MEIWNEIQKTQNQLDEALKGLSKVGEAKAKTEKEYRMALSKRLMELRVEGIPVTMCGDIARGEEHIAKLKEKRDIADSLYDSKKEAINVKKLELRVQTMQYETEFNNEK